MIAGLTSADATEILAEVSAMIDRAMLDLDLAPGDARVQVRNGLLFHIVSAAPLDGLPAATGLVREESPIRIRGRELMVRDADRGVWAPGRSYTVLGREFGSRDELRVPGVGSAFGGFLYWVHSLTLSKTGTGEASTLQVTDAPVVDLIHATTPPVSLLPTYTLTEPSPPSTSGDITVSDAAGTLYELCATYDRLGRVTIHKARPALLNGKPWNHA